MCTFGRVVALTGHIRFEKKKVHIWSSLLDFPQIIDAVIIHLEQKHTFPLNTESLEYFSRTRPKLPSPPELTGRRIGAGINSPQATSLE